MIKIINNDNDSEREENGKFKKILSSEIGAKA